MPGATSTRPVPFPDMLRALAQQKATGILRVQSSKGWKVLELQAGAIHLVSSVAAGRLKLGEILLARGKLTPDALQRALKAQKSKGLPLGEVLVQKGLATRSDIHDIVRFQIEEEIYELFTWRDAACSFTPGATLGERIDFPDAAKLSIDPMRILGEAARRIPLWEEIGRKMPSQNLIFRLTERGKAMMHTASRGGGRLLELIRAGYSVEFLVRKTLVGRFALCKALTDLLEAGAIAAIPDGEVRLLLNRWEQQGLLEQALGAARMLAEYSSDPGERAAFEDQARRLDERLRAAPAEKPAPRRLPRAVVLGGVAAVLVIGALILRAVIMGEPVEESLESFSRAQEEANELLARGEFEKAREVWVIFLAWHTTGTAAELAKSQLEFVEEEYERQVSQGIEKAKKLVSERKYGEAVRLYHRLAERYPHTRMAAEIANLRAQAESKQAELTRELGRDALARALAEGRRLLDEERYIEALQLLEKVAKSRAAGPELRDKAEELLKVIRRVEARAEELVSKARAEERSGRPEEALKLYDEGYALWSSSELGRVASDGATRLKLKRKQAEDLYLEALKLRAGGDSDGAVGRLREIAEKYRGFSAAEKAAKRLSELTQAEELAAELLARARALRANRRHDEATAMLLEIVERYPFTRAAQKVKLNVRIESVPSDVTVTIDGKELGRTPLMISLGPHEKGTLVLSKPGFGTLRTGFGEVRKATLKFYLQREVAFRRVLGRGGKVVMVSLDEALCALVGREALCFDTRGELRWRTVLKGLDPSGVLGIYGVDDLVYVVSRAGEMRAMSAETGREAEPVALPSEPMVRPAFARLRLLAGRLFAFVGCRDGRLVCLDLEAGDIRWEARLGILPSGPAANDKLVLAPAPGGKLVALDAVHGAGAWEGLVSGEIASDVALDGAGRRAAVVTTAGELAVFETESGRKIAQISLVGAHGGALLLAEGRGFVCGDDGKVRAFDPQDGRVLWTAAADAPIKGSPAHYKGRKVYFATEKGKLVCLDGASGGVKWQLDLGAPPAAAPLVAGDKLFVANLDGELLCLDLGLEETLSEP